MIYTLSIVFLGRCNKTNSPSVTHQDINKFVETCPQRCDLCRHVMQKARVVVSETPESRRRNFQITCTDHINWCFYSGSEGNKIEIIVEDGKVGIGAKKPHGKSPLR